MIIESEHELLVPAHLNFGQYALQHLRYANPSSVCLENYDTGKQMTYRDFIQYAVNLSTALSELGIKKGDIVGVGSERRISFLPTTLAVVFTGAAYTPFDVEIGRSVFRHELNLAKPNYFITSRSFWILYKDIVESVASIKTVLCFDETEDIKLSFKKILTKHVEVDSFEPAGIVGQTDLAFILFSSGTTGMPKAVPITHLCSIIRSSPVDFQNKSLKTALIFGEWCHSYDIFITYKVIFNGRKIVYMDIPAPETILKTISDCQVNVAIVTPSIVSYLGKAEEVDKYDLNSLSLVLSGGCPLHPRHIENIKRRLPKLENVTQLYGMTESGALTSEFLGTKGRKPGSIGMAFYGITLKVVDLETRKILGPNQRGEICARGPVLSQCYNGVDPTNYLDEQGFFRTGDVGYYDEDKYFFIVGRVKDMLCYEGFQVAPMELESILMQHPDVREAVVVGKPAEDMGEEPAALVVREPGSNITEQELVDYVALEVPPYMQLRGGLKFVPELKKNSRGKVSRLRMRELYF